MSNNENLLPVVSDLDGTEVFRGFRATGATVQVPYTVLAAEIKPVVSGLTALTGAGTADGDLHEIYDVSATAYKKQTISELAIAIASRLVGAVVASGGLTVTAGGLTVTAGGAAITAGGLSVAAGAVSLPLTDYADDAAAAAGGVAVGGLYRTASAVKVRVA